MGPRLEPALWPQLRTFGLRRPLLELVSEESLARFNPGHLRLREFLPRLAWALLVEEDAQASEARETLARRLVPPGDPSAAKVHRLLCELRARVPRSVAPRPERLLQKTLLRFEPLLPGFQFEEQRGADGLVPEGTLTITPSGAKTSCSCQRPSCVHALAAQDALLLWLQAPPAGAEAILAELLLPEWERTLKALDRAAQESAESSATFTLSWRLMVIDGYGVEVWPYLHRRNRRGQQSAGTRMTRRRLLVEHGSQLGPLDARLVGLMPEVDAPAPRSLLLELIGHPQLFLEESPELPVRIERAKVGLLAQTRGTDVVVTAGVEGAPLPLALVERLRRAPPDELVYLWDEGPRRLTLLDASQEVRALLSVLQRHGNSFPPESHGALIEKLSLFAQRLPVAMPRSVMGEATAPDYRQVVRLEAQPGGRVIVELRTRPLPESTALPPGEGPRDVHVRRGEKPVHAVRDFARELLDAEALRLLLPLKAAVLLPQPFAYLLDTPEECLALLSVCETLEPRPGLEWRGLPLRLVLSKGPPALQVVLEKRRDWFGVLGGLSVEGERVELAVLLEAARRKERFVRLGEPGPDGQSYVEIAGALRAHLEKLADHVHSSRQGLQISPAGAEALRGLEAAGAQVEADRSWQLLVERIFASKSLTPKAPRSLKAELRDYQLEGYRWLLRLASWGAGGVLADDMGLGKTVEALAVLLERQKLGPALVVAPTSVGFNWIDEARHFAPSLKLSLYADSADRATTLDRLGPGDVLVLSYGLLTRDLERLAKIRFSSIVFDEAQQLKNQGTQRFKAARALQGDFKFALSGTPLENHLGELWSLFGVVFPALLGSWEAFRSRFAVPIEQRRDPTAAPALARVLQPFLLRRTKAQVEAQLPARTEVRVPVVLSNAEWQLYEDARLAALSTLESPKSVLREQERRIEVLAALTRLRLLASHPRLFDQGSKVGSAKEERLHELLRELIAEGQRVLVFSQFTSHLALVREQLEARQIAYEYLDGKTPQAARGARVKAFQEGTAPLFLISLKAGGVGLNLTAATSVIHLDPWWNPAVEDQASDRAHRLGQTRPVTIYRLVARGTIEEQMLALHDEKRSLVAAVLEGKDQAGRLSTRELVAMLSQRLLPPGPLEVPATRH